MGGSLGRFTLRVRIFFFAMKSRWNFSFCSVILSNSFLFFCYYYFFVGPTGRWTNWPSDQRAVGPTACTPNNIYRYKKKRSVVWVYIQILFTQSIIVIYSMDWPLTRLLWCWYKGKQRQVHLCPSHHPNPAHNMLGTCFPLP